MDRTGQPKSSCVRYKYKVRYRTMVKALNAIQQASMERDTILRVYTCTYCHGFHLTSQPNISTGDVQSTVHGTVQRSVG